MPMISMMRWSSLRKEFFFVDDLLKSLRTSQDAIKMQREFSIMLLQEGFHLKKWISNRKEVLNAISENEMSKELKNINLDYDALPSERALGLHWDVESDMFTFQISVKNKPPTCRGILSIVSSAYDPLGYYLC